MISVVALVACHNRRQKTVRALGSFFEQRVPGASLSAVMVDDGSTDGTSQIVAQEFDAVTIVRGDGNLYWARSMQRAESVAKSSADFLLWLNDDVVLFPDALRTLLEVSAACDHRAIVVGALTDPDSGAVTYSGVHRTRHPLRFQRVEPLGEPVGVDTFNGNLVLIPGSIASVVGGIDGAYGHGAADFDYGLRARKLGIEVVVAGSPAGECRRDHPQRPWLDRTRPALDRWRELRGPKGLPLRASARFLRRHGGVTGSFFLLTAYGRFVLSLVPRRVVFQRSGL